MTDILDQARELAARRQQILDAGVGWAHMDEYNACTMKLAEMAPQLIAEVEQLRERFKGIEQFNVEWKRNDLTFVDLLIAGQRVVGHVDPWYPNKPPALTTQPNLALADLSGSTAQIGGE